MEATLPTTLTATDVGAATGPRPAELQGIVDNVSMRNLYGWAWNLARPEERVTVELRLGEEVVTEAVASIDRPDLLRAGIGDGCHAFSLPLTAACMQRRSELLIMARAADGTCTQIPFRVRRKPEDDGIPALQRAVQDMGSGQRQREAGLQQALRDIRERLPEPGEREALRSLAATQARLEERLEVLLLSETRLDERISALPTAASASVPRRLDAWQAGLMAVLGGVAALALSGLPQLLAR